MELKGMSKIFLLLILSCLFVLKSALYEYNLDTALGPVDNPSVEKCEVQRKNKQKTKTESYITMWLS